MNRFKRIIFTFNSLVFSVSISLLNAQANLSGFVKDDKGSVLAGANVYLSGTEMGSATGANGKYEIENIKSGNYTLIVSYLGYNTEKFELNLTGNATKDVALTPSALEIEALQVTGTIIKDRKTRKKVIDAQKELKRKNITDVKQHLRDHGLIKAGSKAPNDIMRKMYECSMLSGDITNQDSDVLMHNFLNENE